jgi:bifunctional non-homologous end joining protein LigD
LVESFEGEAAALLRAACEAGLEGIVSKRRDQPYRGGRADWVKCNCNVEEVLIIGGYVPGRSKKSIGELLIGRRQGRKLLYAGRVSFGLGSKDGDG